MKIQNPIIRGFYPDPSICEANGKYYVVCSTFQFFPGVPIFESEDLINWKQVGNCLTRLSQVELHQIPSSGGVFAPTLRYYDGTFYMVTNNNTFGKNFYISTKDITGEWSEPIFVDQEGIDPSLLFDNGKVYFTSNGTYEGKGCIMQCEIDINTGEKLTETVPIWIGNGGRYLESPHLYHIGKYYYLFAAEGGTEYGHMITYARAEKPFGPFESYAGNPLLTNRNVGGNENLIQGIGHGDLIQYKDGNYYIICLGFRQNGIWSPFHHLGREVFLAPVFIDDNGWIFAKENGQVNEWVDTSIETSLPSSDRYNISFENTDLSDFRWMYIRDYKADNYRFENHKLILKGTEIDLNKADTPTFVGIRQSEFYTDLSVVVNSQAKEAGVTFYMDEQQHYDLFVYNDAPKEKCEVRLRIRVGDAESINGRIVLEDTDYEGGIKLHIVSTNEEYSFYVVTASGEIHLGSAKCKYLSSEVAGGFTGVLMGLYAVDNNGQQAVFSELAWVQKNAN
ncbi:MAG: family 43 glycosylhydrolase [Lachnospiraceae bacterium]|nr:family 43 glycosylhydrolase [Lachnospiraceae bacterium]